MEWVCLMAKWGKCDFTQLKQLQKQVEKLQKNEDKFCDDCAKYLAARLLAKVIKRTPVGKAKIKGYTGGTLRRGWTTQAGGSGAEGMKTSGAAQYVQSLKVQHFGQYYVIEITNPVYYASYVEFGHRTANHKGWVPGQFMLIISERELQSQAPKMLEKKIAEYLKEVF